MDSLLKAIFAAIAAVLIIAWQIILIPIGLLLTVSTVALENFYSSEDAKDRKQTEIKNRQLEIAEEWTAHVGEEFRGVRQMSLQQRLVFCERHNISVEKLGRYTAIFGD